MASLKMELHDPVFTTRCRVIYGDTDAGGVVYNANYLRYFEVGRTEMMRAWAVPYSEIEKRGLVLPVTESYVRYKAPALYDDLEVPGRALQVLPTASVLLGRPWSRRGLPESPGLPGVQ